jgi:outer membrane protein TolC
MLIRNLSVSFIILLSPFIAYSQAVTLSDALSKINQAPKAEIAHSQAEEASWKKVETYSGFLPSLSLNGNYLFDKRYMMVDINFGGSPTSIAQIIPTTSYSLTANWLVFDGFANIDRFSSAKANEAAFNDNYAWAKFQQEREIVLLFYKALAAQSLKQVAEQSVKTLEDHLGDTKLLKKNGVSTNYDLLQVEVKVSEAKSEILNATDNVSIATMRLGEALGEDYSNVQVRGELPTIPPEILNSFSKDTLARKDLSALKHKVEALDQQVDAASKHWVPKVSLVGAYEKYNNINDHFSDSNAFRDAYNYGLMLTWNFFDGFSSTAKKNEIIEQRFQTQKGFEIAQAKAASDLELWKRKLQYYISVYQARKSDAAKSAESVRLAKAGRRAGVRTNADLLDAEFELFRANANVVNAQIGEIESLINLELTSGKKLFNFKN